MKRLAGNIDVPQSAFFDVLSSRRAFSTQARFVVDPVSAYLPDEMSTSLPRLQQRQPAPLPLSAHIIPPHVRSARLSTIHRLTSSPKPTASSHEVFSAYVDLASSYHAYSLTPGEVHEIIHTLHRLQRRETVGRRQAHVKLRGLFRELRRLRQPISAEPVRGLETAALVSRSRHTRRVTTDTARGAEKTVLSLFPNPASITRDSKKRRYQASVNHLLHLCGEAADERTFEPWWERMKGVLEPDSYAFLARLVLLGKTGQVDEMPGVLNVALESVTDPGARIILINHVMFQHAIADKWDVVASIYTRLGASTTSEPLPFPLDADPRDIVDLPTDLRPSRFTYSALVHALARSGHMYAALTVIRHMYEADLTPFISEYISLFKGFARHGEVPESVGAAKRLFPFWETYQVGRQPKKDRLSWIWSRGALGVSDPSIPPSPWTSAVLRELFESFMALSPGMREMREMRDTRRAPSPQGTWRVLAAFARVTNGDLDVVKGVWGAMDRKFEVGSGWTGWRDDARLRKIRLGLQRVEGFRLKVDEWE